MSISDNGVRSQQKRETLSLHLSKTEKTSAEREAARLGHAGISEYLLALHQRSMTERVGSQRQREERTSDAPDKASPRSALMTEHGTIFCGDSSTLMQSTMDAESVDLVMTSPPFGLVRKKAYGNEDADQYLEWFKQFAEGFTRVLKPGGSLVIDYRAVLGRKVYPPVVYITSSC